MCSTFINSIYREMSLMVPVFVNDLRLFQQFSGAGDTCTADDPGFPMSQFLKHYRLHISRNATMVAQQVTESQNDITFML